MKIEFVAYSPARGGVNLAAVRGRLPEKLRAGLMQRPRDTGSIFFVNEKDPTVIAAFDEYFKVGRRGSDVVKKRRAEVDKDDLDAYSFYRISPDPLEWEHGFDAEFRLPQCEERPWPAREGVACPAGAGISPPYRVDEHKIGSKRQLAWVSYPQQQGVELFLRRDLYEVFRSEGITGLDYEPCGVQGKAKDEDVPFGALAHVLDGGGAYRALSVDRTRVCTTHRTLFGGAGGQVLCDGELRDLDFQTVRKVVVGKEVYSTWPPPWFVSKRAVKLLMSNHVVGLGRIALFLDAPFTPVLFDP